MAGDGGRVARSFPYGSENIKLDRCPERRGALMGLQHFENQGGSQGTFGTIPKVHISCGSANNVVLIKLSEARWADNPNLTRGI